MASSVALVGPWALLVLLTLFLVWAYCLVRLVLTKSIQHPADCDISVGVRPFPWPRVEIDVRVLRAEVDEKCRWSNDHSQADVVPIREDVRETG
jgi:hypothetical protein